jgi:hypothetical protein
MTENKRKSKNEADGAQAIIWNLRLPGQSMIGSTSTLYFPSTFHFHMDSDHQRESGPGIKE